MAHHKSAIKRIRQNEKRRIRNQETRSKSRTLHKKVVAALGQGNVEEAKKALVAAIPAMDKAVAKGVLKRKTASRKISRLAKKVHRSQTGSAA